jgi:hypothetical protein
MDDQPNVDGIKESIEQIIGSETNLKKRKKTPEEIQKEKFIRLIDSIENVFARSGLTRELSIDTSKYDESFYEIIDDLIEMNFGKDVSKIIFHYLYKDDDNKLKDEKGNIIPLENASDLYTLVRILQEFNSKPKTKK